VNKAARLFLFTLSGGAGLVYQTIWQRLIALQTGLGAEAIATIVASFLFGLGLGAFLAGRLSLSLSPKACLVAFAVAELLIGLFGLSSAVVIDAAGPWLAAEGIGGLARFVLQLAITLPSTFLMGASLPFLVKATVVGSEAASVAGALYAVNTLGAAAGAIATPWLLVPAGGFLPALRFAAVLNITAALIAAFLQTPRESAAASTGASGSVDGEKLKVAYFFAAALTSGVLGIGLEIVWFRILDVAIKASAVSFGTLLGLYLVGLGAGSFYGVRRGAVARPMEGFLTCLAFSSIYATLTVGLVTLLPPTLFPLDRLVSYWEEAQGYVLGVDRSAPLTFGLYFLLPLLTFGPPTFASGLAFVRLQQAAQGEAARSGFVAGLLQGANITGSVAGALLAGLAGFKWLGSLGTLQVLALSVVPLFAAVLLFERHQFRARRLGAICLAVVLAAGTVPSSERLWQRLHGEKLRGFFAEDETGVTGFVPRTSSWGLVLGGREVSWIPYGGIHSYLGVIPALMHEEPARVAIIGLGSGDTASGALMEPRVGEVHVFELVKSQGPVLIEAERRLGYDKLTALLRDPRVRLRFEDGRRALEREAVAYDVIQMDPLQPYTTYSNHVYSLEFVERLRERLAPSGLAAVWAASPRVEAAFASAFPHVIVHPVEGILIASMEPLDARVAEVRRKLEEEGAKLSDERLEKQIRRLFRQPWRAAVRSDDMNRDLDPRDEFLVPHVE
jgi:spermidine synthase